MRIRPSRAVFMLTRTFCSPRAAKLCFSVAPTLPYSSCFLHFPFLTPLASVSVTYAKGLAMASFPLETVQHLPVSPVPSFASEPLHWCLAPLHPNHTPGPIENSGHPQHLKSAINGLILKSDKSDWSDLLKTGQRSRFLVLTGQMDRGLWGREW